MKVTDLNDNVFELTDDEVKYYRALIRLSNMKTGRIRLFANGQIDIRINGVSANHSFEMTHIQCDGGDGGDNFD
jgi:hypothetical protein